MNWKQLKGGIYGGSGWYLKSEVLLSLEIETGHKYKYILKEASDGNLLLSKVVPVIVDVTDQQDKRTVSQMTESGDALYRNIKYDGEDFYHLEKVFADLQKINIEEFNISTNTIELLTLEIPYEGLLLFSNFIKEKNWYKEGDIVRIAFSYDQRYKKIWPNWLRVNRAYGRYDIFVQTPEGGWYCWPNSGMDSQRYVNSID